MRSKKIAVVGAECEATPIVALLASTPWGAGSPPPDVVIVQRRFGTACFDGGSAAGDATLRPFLATGHAGTTHTAAKCADADVVLVSLPVGRNGLTPDYSAVLDALDDVASALRNRPSGKRPLVIIESTLAPSTMESVIEPLFARHGLVDGIDIMLANSPVSATTHRRLVGGVHPETPLLVASFYAHIMKREQITPVNSMTAEVVSTLMNAWRDVHVAFSSEIARYCERIDVDYATLREQVNDVIAWHGGGERFDGVPREGALVMPTVGVGGRALPRDGILFWWRALEAGQVARNSILLAARSVNDASPASTIRLARANLGGLAGRRIAVLGASSVADSNDTAASPSLVLARLLRDSGADVMVHDPHVQAHDESVAGVSVFTNDIEHALADRSVVFLATPHTAYRALLPRLRNSSGIDGVVDACNLFVPSDFEDSFVRYAGIGRGRRAPDGHLVRSVVSMYRAVVRGVANEVEAVVDFLNRRHAVDEFNRVDFQNVRRLAATYSTGCDIDGSGDVPPVESHEGFISGLAQLALDSAEMRHRDPRRGPPEPVPPGIWFGNEDAAVARETPWPLTPHE